MFDINKIEKEAEKEIREDQEKEAKKRLKSIMTDIRRAKEVVRGLERELLLLKEEIGESV